MGFPVKPECLNLRPLEKWLISQRIPFMQIRTEFPRGGQLSIHGNVVNVPVDVNPVVNTLPRPLTEWITNHSYQIKNEIKLQTPLSVSEC